MIDATKMRSDTIQGAQSRRGGVIAWLVISLLLVSAFLVIGGLFFAHTIKVRQTRAGNDVQVDTPFGSVHVQHNGDGRLESTGMPIYPHAKPLGKGDSATVDLSQLFGDNDLHIVAGKWATPDPIDKVQKYYEDKFPDMSVIQHSGKIEMHSIDRHGKRVIVLRDRGGSTEISLASVGEPKAN
jgi:hypothetical protein